MSEIGDEKVEQVYRLIVSEGPMTTKELREKSELAVGHVYKALGELEKYNSIYRVTSPLAPHRSDYVFTPAQDPPEEVAMVSYET